ncbi:toprim domain-containing protein [Bradyrhizobium sp. ISRA443]|uniref:DUF7146 domain-containing protein n=1 Tax=unclassified Bradyrhizobium TaxID=2631580 RepID=UPI0024784F69|nr:MULTISPECIES: toprim domain-containing protein [unclassified Bradyrhizobium]WGR93045.1 toprim domain-containing protein [Bradyrhizobium sp. ISRA435]WGR97544.1 toprim domain-containing protein [Bradyrhizobium sp. ISRA436]WGS04434.1 toprim domain-containing protein [Bradyrhizobium sp. ISRA437]WGS11315.1 toprim domain-containing protein [Bradyrhizobium sp. ISRA443]
MTKTVQNRAPSPSRDIAEDGGLRDASELAHRLARQAEAVCRHYLSNGRRQGRYWVVGDSRNTPGRSLFVRLNESLKGPAGKWTDAATGEHGDLLDIIRGSCGLVNFRDVAEEARRFLSMLRPVPRPTAGPGRGPAQTGSVEAARRLFAMSQPISRTVAQVYLRRRGITSVHDEGALRFRANCYYRPNDVSPTQVWPAMIARVTDLEGRITGVHRTWLHPSGRSKAPVDTPRRALGDLLGNAVRFGPANDVMAAGEGIETMLSLRFVLPTLPMVAALSANHLAGILLPPSLRRLYIARDADAAGRAAAMILTTRAEAAGIEALTLSPSIDDFNADLRTLAPEEFRAGVLEQLVPEDAVRFFPLVATDSG